MYQEGDLIADFTLPGLNAAGQITRISLKDMLAQQPYLILYVYPKDDTPGCTAEACDFRDQQALWSPKATLVGLSPDPPSSHVKFYEGQRLNFPLWSDETLMVITKLGAFGEKKLYGKVMQGVIRSTFILQANGRLLKAFRNVKALGHAARVMKELAQLP